MFQEKIRPQGHQEKSASNLGIWSIPTPVIGRPLVAYIIAICATLAAFFMRQSLTPFLGNNFPFITFFPAIMAGAIFAGLLPGLLASCLAVVLIHLWILHPTGDWWPISAHDAAGLMVFLLGSISICVLAGFNHRSRKFSEEHERTKALRDRDERFRTLADNIAQLIWVADEKGRAYWYNQRWLDFTGTTLEEMLARGWQPLHHPEHVERARGNFHRCLASGEIWEDTFPLRGKEGEFRWFLVRAIPLRNQEGKVWQWFGTNTDITTQRLTEEALHAATEKARAADRAKGEFIATISHELRTPMTVILGALELLQQSGPAEKQVRLLQMADGASHRLLGIIDDLLEISRLEAQRLKLSLHPFEVRDIIRQVVETFSVQAREKGLALEWKVSPEVPAKVRGDARRVGQILTNLVGNAVKFTDGGSIAVSVSVAGEALIFQIRDTGIGIPADKIELLFRPFTQIDGSLTRPYGGTGLGLAISRQIADLMGGSIQAESIPGKGSLFTLTLPLPAIADAPLLTASPAESGKSPAGRVLVVEDDPMVRDLLQIVLRRRGLEVTTAEDGRQAVASWQENRFSLVLMDLQMPEMNGLEATRVIRRLEKERGGETCIIALTAHARAEDQEECLAAGMNSVLTKPLRMGNLLAAVDTYLASESGASRQAVGQA